MSQIHAPATLRVGSDGAQGLRAAGPHRHVGRGGKRSPLVLRLEMESIMNTLHRPCKELTTVDTPLAAMHRAILHFQEHMSFARASDREELVVLMRLLAATGLAAYAAASRRLLGAERAAPADMRQDAQVATLIEASLPAEYGALWRVHYVEGLPLSEYASRFGLTHEAARADYLAIVGELDRCMRAAADPGPRGVETSA